jgi:TRAP-type mannitol/chloroaromatic compound transport system substrate-binding protein
VDRDGGRRMAQSGRRRGARRIALRVVGDHMERRRFLSAAGQGIAAGSALAAAPLVGTAYAQSAAEIRWRLTSSFPKSLDTIYGAAEYMAERVAAATDGKFQIQVFAAGELVPGLQALDAVQNGTVEMCHTASYYYVGKDPTFAFGTAIPFGMNTRNHMAWFYRGGGNELMQEFYDGYNVVHIVCGQTGAQMGGWYRKEIKTPADLDGLKIRIGGFAGQVLTKLGAVPQQIAGGDIYPALEKGTIDAAEWVGPYDDEKLGFYKVAQNYYYPGWWEGAAQLQVMINKEQWAALPPAYQAIVQAAAAEANNWMMGGYDSQNPGALKRLAAQGVKFHPFPKEVLAACQEAAFELYAETSAANPKFKKVYDSYRAYQADAELWFKFSENTFDNFVLYNQQKA